MAHPALFMPQITLRFYAAPRRAWRGDTFITVGVNQRCPSHIPKAAHTRQSALLHSILTIAFPALPFKKRRALSMLYAEKVVNPPRNPVTTKRRSPAGKKALSKAAKLSPIANAPAVFTTSVPNGKIAPARCTAAANPCTATVTPKRQSAPKPPPKKTSMHFIIIKLSGSDLSRRAGSAAVKGDGGFCPYFATMSKKTRSVVPVFDRLCFWLWRAMVMSPSPAGSAFSSVPANSPAPDTII